MGIRERSALRRKKIRSHRAHDFEDAERWDLQFWQDCSPEERLSALVALKRDVEKVQESRRSGKH